jgi:hypothetical protein
VYGGSADADGNANSDTNSDDRSAGELRLSAGIMDC